MKYLMRVTVATALIVAFACSRLVMAETDAYIKLQLDGSQVFSGDVVVLDVESTGLLEPIDFSVLEQNLSLLRQTIGTRIAVNNGKVREIAIQRMVLQPKRSGILVIGPLKAGEIVSNSVHINVLDSTRPDWTPRESDAQIITSLTPNNAVVNQQMLYTVELLHRYPINSESITLPELRGFSKRNLIESRRTFKGDNRDWFRTEWQTLIYPRQSGTLEIGPVEWSGTLAKSNVERADFSRRSEPQTIFIQSAAADSGGWWLPAKSVVLSESWSSPPTELSAGDELERTITVQASDVLSGQIPTPKVPESRALVQTLINSTRQETVTGQRIVSEASFVYRVTAQSPIPVFLDTVRIPWWDTQQQLAREAIIPARRINVGLPDRADLLSKLALEESGLSRLKFQLQTVSPMRLTSYIAAGMALLYLLWQSMPYIRQALSQDRLLNRHLKYLTKIARRGDAHELYQTLKTPQSVELLQGNERALVSHLESVLFSEHPDKQARCDDFPLHDWLKPVIKQARQTKASVNSNDSGGLAKL